MASKYSLPLVQLMAALPGREFKMADLVRYLKASSEFSKSSPNTIRAGIAIALKELVEIGVVKVEVSPVGLGGHSMYRWLAGP